MWRFHGEEDRGFQAHRCNLLRSRLTTSRRELEAAIAPRDHHLARSIDEAVRDGDQDRMVALGIDPRYAWTRDIARAFVAGGRSYPSRQ